MGIKDHGIKKLTQFAMEVIRRSVFVKDVRASQGGQFGQVMANRIKELGLQTRRIGLLECSPGRNFDVMPFNHFQTLRQQLPQAEFITRCST